MDKDNENVYLEFELIWFLLSTITSLNGLKKKEERFLVSLYIFLWQTCLSNTPTDVKNLFLFLTFSQIQYTPDENFTIRSEYFKQIFSLILIF